MSNKDSDINVNPDIRMEVTDVDSDENAENSVAIDIPDTDREQHIFPFQNDLAEIPEDSPLESIRVNRIRKKPIHTGELNNYNNVQHAIRKISQDVQSGKLPAEVLHQVQKLSETNILVGGRKISAAEFFLHPSSGPPSRKSSINAFYSINRQISILGGGGPDSINEDTIETLPNLESYSALISALTSYNSQRPTMEELRSDERKLQGPSSPDGQAGGFFENELKNVYTEPAPEKKKEKGPSKFGWIQGVLVRCLLNIFGVIMFLRLPWITGQAGIGLASVIIILSCVVTIITTTSMSAICTNGEVKGGGAYFMISRSLGPEFGGSIGVVFSLANALAAALHIVGFSETVQDLMMEHDATITGDRVNDVRVIGVATAALLIAIVIIGMEWEAKAQVGMLVILTVAIINFFVGTFIPKDDETKWKGVLGYDGEIFKENFGPNYREGVSFFSVFSIFFPAATGILAGANISGDLKNPSSAIPKGTFLAIIITGIIYLAMTWCSGATVLLDAVGPEVISMYINKTATPADAVPTLANVANCEKYNTTCKFGLKNDYGVVGLISGYRPLVLAGIFSAALSSALACMVGAPKVFQALGKDKLFPGIGFFAKGYGKGEDPRRGYVLTFFICVGITCIGSLDIIAPIISNFFLMNYALVNFSCFSAAIADSPGFRPSFKYFNKWVSLLGALASLVIMFVINWWGALATFVIIAALYAYVKIKGPEINWGSSTQAHFYKNALESSRRLVKIEEHVKNFRPQILVLSGYPKNRPVLVNFASSITKKQSLLICGHVFMGDMSEHVKNLRSLAAYHWFEKRRIKAFYSSVVTPTLRVGAQVLMQALGLGKLRPNTLFLGYKTTWQNDNPFELVDYVNIIHDAFDLNFGVGILRVPEGLNKNSVLDAEFDVDILDSDSENDDISDRDQDKKKEAQEGENNFEQSNKSGTNSYTVNSDRAASKNIRLKSLKNIRDGAINEGYMADEDEVAKQAGKSVPIGDRFKDKQRGTIDVWWLYDDGGLTLLIPYILTLRKKWRQCDLRVFIAGSKTTKPDEDEKKMATLLDKFRITYSKLTVIPEIWKKPTLQSYEEFESSIRKFKLQAHEHPVDFPWKISDNDLVENKSKTYRHLRLREQLLIHSADATLIVMTLPVPKKTACPSALYLAWLDSLSRDLPPMLLLRGNQQSVLTYYS